MLVTGTDVRDALVRLFRIGALIRYLEDLGGCIGELVVGLVEDEVVDVRDFEAGLLEERLHSRHRVVEVGWFSGEPRRVPRVPLVGPPPEIGCVRHIAHHVLYDRDLIVAISRESSANVEGLTESPASISGFRKWEHVGHEGKSPDANPRPFR